MCVFLTLVFSILSLKSRVLIAISVYSVSWFTIFYLYFISKNVFNLLSFVFAPTYFVKWFLQFNLNDLWNMALITVLRKEICAMLWPMYLTNRNDFWMGNVTFSRFGYILCFRTHCLTQFWIVIFLLDNKCVWNILYQSYFLEDKLS